MPATVERDGEPSGHELAQELHELEAQEVELERRTRSLEFAGTLALIVSIFGLVLAIAAITVALANSSGGTNTMAATSNTGGNAGQTGSTASAGMMTGAGGHGQFTSAMKGAAAHGKVYVQLGDYWAAPTVSSVAAAKVTFIASNVGHVPHELMVERMPVKFDSPMQPNEAAAQGMVDNMRPGQGGRITMRLRAGTYMLFCNVQGHYAAGQHILFNVTKKS